MVAVSDHVHANYGRFECIAFTAKCSWIQCCDSSVVIAQKSVNDNKCNCSAPNLDDIVDTRWEMPLGSNLFYHRLCIGSVLLRLVYTSGYLPNWLTCTVSCDIVVEESAV